MDISLQFRDESLAPTQTSRRSCHAFTSSRVDDGRNRRRHHRLEQSHGLRRVVPAEDDQLVPLDAPPTSDRPLNRRGLDVKPVEYTPNVRVIIQAHDCPTFSERSGTATFSYSSNGNAALIVVLNIRATSAAPFDLRLCSAPPPGMPNGHHPLSANPLAVPLRRQSRGLPLDQRRVVAHVALVSQARPFNGRHFDKKRRPFADFDWSHAPVDG